MPIATSESFFSNCRKLFHDKKLVLGGRVFSDGTEVCDKSMGHDAVPEKSLRSLGLEKSKNASVSTSIAELINSAKLIGTHHYVYLSYSYKRGEKLFHLPILV